MKIDILDSMSSMLGGSFIRQASTLLGETEEGTRAGVRSGVPALLASLVRDSADPAGAAEIYRTVTGNAVDPGIEGKLGNILGSRGSLESTLSTGESLLGSVLGNRTGGLTHALSQVAGIRPSSATTLLAIAAPLLLGFLKKQVTQGRLDAGGLASLLLSQRSVLQKVGLDERITSALGFGSMDTLVGSAPEGTHARVSESEAVRPEPMTGNTRPHADPAAKSTRAYPEPPPEPVRRRSMLPWAIGLAVAVLGLAFLLNRSMQNRDTRTTTAAATSEDRTTETGIRLRVASLPAQVHFEPGEADIDNADRQTLAEVARSARASGTPLVVTGYTDQTGDAQQNLELAKSRADAVREALVQEGLSESSIQMKEPEFVTGSGSPDEARRVEIAAAE